MSVRLCYMERQERGLVLRGLRLIGQNSADAWPAPSGPPPAAGQAAIEQAADWIANTLAQSRAAGRLEALFLDCEGSVCSWLTSPAADPDVVSIVARMGAGDSFSGASPAASPFNFFAGDQIDSSVQAIGARPAAVAEAPRGTLLERFKPGARNAAHDAPQRLGVLAATDVAARLLIDALDRAGVSVESVASIWHALAQAWDPASPSAPGRSRDDRVVAESEPVCAVILVEPAGRLLWAWSRAGELLAGGSMRLRIDRPENEDPQARYGKDEASRLAAEWLSWSVQIGHAPRRVVCVTPHGRADEPAAFGQAVTAAWPGAAVDLAVHDDPIGATFHRLASSLESTPAPANGRADGAATLVDLTARPGRRHRLLYIWFALFITVAAGVTGAVAWRVRAASRGLALAADQYQIHWSDAVRQVYPDAMGLREGGPRKALKEELDRRRKELSPPERAEPAMPVLDELETISLVFGSSDLSFDQIDLDSSDIARIVVHAKDLRAAENLSDALGRISGSNITKWVFTPEEKDDGKGGKYIRAAFVGTWKRPAPGAGGGT